jgi:DNA-binding transcriptional LysR family regulator
VLVMSRTHPLAAAGVKKAECKYPWIDVRKLKDEAFIMQLPDQKTRQIAEHIFHDSNFEPPVVLEIRNILASVELAAGGYGLTFVSETHLRHIALKEKPACFSVGSPNTMTSFVAVYRKGIYQLHYAQRYIRIVKEFT